jgi:hypothetical protein
VEDAHNGHPIREHLIDHAISREQQLSDRRIIQLGDDTTAFRELGQGASGSHEGRSETPRGFRRVLLDVVEGETCVRTGATGPDYFSSH